LVEQRIRNAKVGSSTLFTGTIDFKSPPQRGLFQLRWLGVGAYNRSQWIESFEGQLAILRPHLTQRVLSTLSLAAWHAHGANDLDPIQVARALSAEMDKPTKTPGGR
jgi:hypothetical protein